MITIIKRKDWHKYEDAHLIKSYIYECSPIDYQWSSLLDLSDEDERHELISKFEKVRGFRAEYAKCPKIIPLPNPEYNNFEDAIIWKEVDNGTVYIISPFSLSWLKDYLEYLEINIIQ